ncbi:hypothetical protein NODU109028_19205 [Nocardioides dubius]|uniref:Restriction system protein Mrr-like N-terminal domain-containing protein n=1 Tax=Nocardioides dubius TaxID=317019 RepID=A0ABP4EDG5_9ACTN
MNGDDYCELCDLRLSECHHGRPAPTPPPPAPKAAPAPRKTTTTRRVAVSNEPPVSARATQRRWTSSAELEPMVIAILEEAGGDLGNDEVLEQIAERLGDHFRPGDQDKTPTGELRWQLAARKARQQLIAQGVMTKSGPGRWTLA